MQIGNVVGGYQEQRTIRQYINPSNNTMAIQCDLVQANEHEILKKKLDQIFNRLIAERSKVHRLKKEVKKLKRENHQLILQKGSSPRKIVSTPAPKIVVIAQADEQGNTTTTNNGSILTEAMEASGIIDRAPEHDYFKPGMDALSFLPYTNIT